MKTSLFITVAAVFALSLPQNLVLAAPPPASATCNISCTVADIAEWSDTSSPATNLPDITTQNSQVSSDTPLMLYTNGHVKINANYSVSAQLSKDDNHKLVTVYKLEYDTADTITVWSSYGSLLSNDSAVKHISGDGAGFPFHGFLRNGATEVTLSLRASNDSRALGDSGEYSATLTLTVCWK